MGLSSDQIKIAAISAMLIDHIAVSFISPLTFAYFIMRFVGKMTIPIMCYFIAEGYYHTGSLKRYAIRLLLAAVLSHIPFYYFLTGNVPQTIDELLVSLTRTGVMWTLFLGLIALSVWESELSAWVKPSFILTLISLAVFGDWKYFAVIWILIFGVYRKNTAKKYIYFVLAALPYIFGPPFKGFITGVYYPTLYFQAGLLLPIPILLIYNGSRYKSSVVKWMYYLFYPVHLMLLAFIRECAY